MRIPWIGDRVLRLKPCRARCVHPMDSVRRYGCCQRQLTGHTYEGWTTLPDGAHRWSDMSGYGGEAPVGAQDLRLAARGTWTQITRSDPQREIYMHRKAMTLFVSGCSSLAAQALRRHTTRTDTPPTTTVSAPLKPTAGTQVGTARATATAPPHLIATVTKKSPTPKPPRSPAAALPTRAPSR